MEDCTSWNPEKSHPNVGLLPERTTRNLVTTEVIHKEEEASFCRTHGRYLIQRWMKYGTLKLLLLSMGWVLLTWASCLEGRVANRGTGHLGGTHRVQKTICCFYRGSSACHFALGRGHCHSSVLRTICLIVFMGKPTTPWACIG